MSAADDRIKGALASRSSVRLSAVVLASWVAAGCAGLNRDASPVVRTGPGEQVVFDCDGGKAFAAEFDDADDSVLLRISGRVTRLPHVRAASGAKYSNGTTTLWTKGKTAFVEIKGAPVYQNCRRVSRS